MPGLSELEQGDDRLDSCCCRAETKTNHTSIESIQMPDSTAQTSIWNLWVHIQIISPSHLYLNPIVVVKQYQIRRLITIFLFFHSVALSLSYCSNSECGGSVTTAGPYHLLPKASPVDFSKPFLPYPAPSPFLPSTGQIVPQLSGKCRLNFTADGNLNLMNTTSTDCWSFFAPLLANVTCCPQLQATLTILMGQSSTETGLLALNKSESRSCVADVDKFLLGMGSADNLSSICMIHSSYLTEGLCPIKHVQDFEKMVDFSKLLTSCKTVDPIQECCKRTCQDAVSDVAVRIASGSSQVSSKKLHGDKLHSRRVSDCTHVTLRYLARRFDSSHAKKILRVLSSCNLNKVCPLIFPDISQVVASCGDKINHEQCCTAVHSYVMNLQKQKFITNLQALDCAATLALKLQKSNITTDLYSLCHINLQDFSLQVAKQDSGCLLSSLPSDAIFDKTTGVSFICDFNDDIQAPWSPSPLLTPCSRSVRVPDFPSAANDQSGGLQNDLPLHAHVATLIVLMFSQQALFNIILHHGYQALR